MNYAIRKYKSPPFAKSINHRHIFKQYDALP